MLPPLFLLLSLAIAFYMAWNIGANDLANAMGTSVGSKALTVRRAVLVAAIFNFSGATLAGKHVTETIRKGVVNPSHINDPSMLAIGAFAALIAASLWITFATWKGLPVSTTHSIVGAVIGYGIVVGGLGCVSWKKVVHIVGSWIFSPLAGAVLAFITFFLIRKFILDKANDRMKIERTFAFLQVMTASYVAFAHGSNDVANAIGPMNTILNYAQPGTNLEMAAKLPVPKWLLMFGGFGIMVGMASWGYRVIRTVGEKVTELSPTRGFSAEFATATIVLLHSFSSLPISTTHTLVGSVLGVGLAGGIRALDFRVVLNIVASWIITIPVTAFLSAVFTSILI
ncbi:MAG: inorganic phosphate transporter [Candidatus Hydrothermarchaeota archaeon]